MNDVSSYVADKPTIAFLPLDLDYRLPNEQQIIDYCYKNHIPESVTRPKGPCWLITPVCGRFNPDEWFEEKSFNNNWFNRYVSNNNPLQYVNNIDKIFPDIKFMLEQLPYKELTIATLFLQDREVGCHIDWFKEDKDTDPEERSIENEPRRFNIQMTNYHYKSTYVAPSEFGERVYGKITKETPGYCISEIYNWHGANLAGKDKVTLFTTGLIDKQKRDELVHRSLQKFKNEAVIFNNGIQVETL